MGRAALWRCMAHCWAGVLCSEKPSKPVSQRESREPSMSHDRMFYGDASPNHSLPLPADDPAFDQGGTIPFMRA